MFITAYTKMIKDATASLSGAVSRKNIVEIIESLMRYHTNNVSELRNAILCAIIRGQGHMCIENGEAIQEFAKAIIKVCGGIYGGKLNNVLCLDKIRYWIQTAEEELANYLNVLISYERWINDNAETIQEMRNEITESLGYQVPLDCLLADVFLIVGAYIPLNRKTRLVVASGISGELESYSKARENGATPDINVVVDKIMMHVHACLGIGRYEGKIPLVDDLLLYQGLEELFEHLIVAVNLDNSVVSDEHHDLFCLDFDDNIVKCD